MIGYNFKNITVAADDRRPFYDVTITLEDGIEIKHAIYFDWKIDDEERRKIITSRLTSYINTIITPEMDICIITDKYKRPCDLTIDDFSLTSALRIYQYEELVKNN